jgi:pyrroline-5-carboxylate reductase
MITNLVLAGCGHMGHAMLWPWLSTKAAQNVFVVEPNASALSGMQGATICASAADLPAHMVPDVVVFAVKPQVLEMVAQEYKKFPNALFLTIAAGKPLAVYESILANSRVIRAMPNLAAKVGEAATLLVAGKKAGPVDKTLAEKLFGVLGPTYWLENESQMDAATALSGCGPGYFYYMAEVMAEAGVSLGLSPELSQQLSRQTLIGSAAFCKTEEASLKTLYQNVAVKGGMTEAAIHVLQENEALKSLMLKALQAAVERARKLAS